MKETLSKISAVGGAVGSGSVAAVAKELQGLTQSLLAGALANTKIDLAAIRDVDTVISALNNNAGTITDITSSISIESLKATGTISVGTAAAGDTVVVNGLTYTLVADTATVGALDFTKVKVGADADACAANLAAVINLRENARVNGPTLSAAAATNVVTVTAQNEGTAANAYGLTETGSSFTVSGATLAGGSATGGIKSTGVTNQIILLWLNKE